MNEVPEVIARDLAYSYKLLLVTFIIFINGCTKISYIDEGSGEVLFMLHGQYGDSSDFEEQLKSLIDYRLIIPDRTGHGNTPYNGTKSTLKEEALDYWTLLDSIGLYWSCRDHTYWA